MMYMFMTTGTVRFLKTVTERYPKQDFYYMKSGASTLVLYESTKKKSLFVSGRSYEVLHSFKEINKKGFVTMEVIPVMEDSMPVFEERAWKVFPKMERLNGLKAIRFLKQIKSNQYIILQQWESERYYVDWKNSSAYQDTDVLSLARLPAYFAERPYTNTYTMLKEDD